MGIAISGSGTRVTIMGSKHAAAAGGNGASMSEETDFTSEMKSSERECLSFSTSLVRFSTYLVCRKYSIIQSLFEKQEKKKKTADSVIKNQSTKSFHKTQGFKI